MFIIDKKYSLDDKIDFREGTVILIDKPLEWTSFDVVNKIRYRLKNYHGVKKIKVGHNGTLDPLATGLLMIFTGKYTKRIPQEEKHDKCYEALIKLGATTESLDRETAECQFKPYDHIDRKNLEIAVSGFLGEQEQLIPVFSATKQKGVAMYKLAREGKEVKPKFKTITINEIDILSFEPGWVRLRIHCGKGTYIRAIARDLGEKLDTTAYLYALRRTHIAGYDVEDALEINDFCTKIENIEYCP